MHAGSRDNRPVERRLDVLVFSSDPLGEPVEILGEVAAEVFLTRDNPYADLFVRLCDVDPRGRSLNVCDGIVRLTDADPLTRTVRVSLVGAAHRFGRGHRIRLQVAGERSRASPATPETGSSTRPPPTSCRRSTTSAWTRRTRRRCCCRSRVPPVRSNFLLNGLVLATPILRPARTTLKYRTCSSCMTRIHSGLSSVSLGSSYGWPADTASR